MRVLMVAPTPFFGDRGCHIRILEEVRALRGLGVESLVATYAVGHEHPEASTVRTPRAPWVKTLPVGFSPHRPYLDGLLFGTTLRAARRFRPDILHGHLHEGAAIGAWGGRPVGRPAVTVLRGGLGGEMIAHGPLPVGGPLPAALRRFERSLLHWPA